MNARTMGFVVVALGLSAISAGAIQNPTKSSDNRQTAQIKVKTELMQLRAIVTDRRGALVDNLSKEDFVLLEDGTPQAISFFAIDRATNKPAVTAAGEPARTAAPEKK